MSIVTLYYTGDSPEPKKPECGLELYIYGSENPKDRGKVHIADETGKPLCGVKIKWGECTAIIERVEPEKDKLVLFVSCFSGRNKVIDRCYSWEFNTCKKCEKKLKELINKK